MKKKEMALAGRQPPFESISCHGCGAPVEISLAPARIWIGRTYDSFVPCLDAPHLCDSCRGIADKVRLSREVMDLHFENGPHRRAGEEATAS